MDWAYRFYRGVLPAEKIIMGIPYYTRGWQNVYGGTNGLHGTVLELKHLHLESIIFGAMTLIIRFNIRTCWH